MTEPNPPAVASEPAEPTTRQQLHAALDEAILAENTKCYHDYAYGSGDAAVAAKAEAHRLIDLLPDPAQTTELEELRAEADKYHRYYNDAMKVRLDVEEVLDDALGTEEEDGAGYGLAGDVALLAQHEKAARAEADTLRGKVEELEAERDALSLLLRGMARKLVAYRKWADGDVPTVYKLRAELDGAHLTLDTMAGRLNQARAERDERQTRINAAFRTCDAAELIAKIGSMEDPDRWKVVFATVTDVRAALNGELPAAEEPTRLHITIPDADAAGDLP